MVRGILVLISMAVPRIMSFSMFSPKIRSFKHLTRTCTYMSSSSDNKKETGHQSGASAPQLTADEQKLVITLREHQSNAVKLPLSEDIRTLLEYSIGYGVLSTNSLKYEGYPTGSVVGFSLDEKGYPFFVFSSMSAHTSDVNKDGRVSLTVTANDFKGAAEGRAVLIGDVTRLEKEKIPSYRDLYMSRHKDAFWIDFGDFTYYIMNSIKSVRFVGGFARAGEVSGEDYTTARPDPLYPISNRVMSHMNNDHEDAIMSIVQHYVGVPVTSAEMVSLDRLGMTVKANVTIAGGSVNKLRIPFPTEVPNPKDVKNMLVEMTKASKS